MQNRGHELINSALTNLRRDRDAGQTRGIASICSAHPDVLSAGLAMARRDDLPVLIEATCNQVNQDGGYTGQTPADFRRITLGLAAAQGLPADRLILGGDHLGPNPWRHLPADEAMAKARAMVAAYAAAGFGKLHLDCSMGCAGEPVALSDDLAAARAAELAEVAEAHAPVPPVYVIGTEVPVPGGALEEVHDLEVTAPEAAATTYEIHRAAFARRGLQAAFDRVIGLVVQPGVEFGNHNVVGYVPQAAEALSARLTQMPGIVYEAHSTDYQTDAALAALVRDGFAILKVGPWLTFALREALYGLDAIDAELSGGQPRLRAAMERLMCASPGHWQKYYPGTAQEQAIMRHFSLSDRIRYYWAQPEAQAEVAALLGRLGTADLPLPLIGQHLGSAEDDVLQGRVPAQAAPLLRASVTRVLDRYARACHPG